MSRSRQNLNLNLLPSKRKLDDYAPLSSAETLAMGRHHLFSPSFSSPSPNPSPNPNPNSNPTRVRDDSSSPSSSSSSPESSPSSSSPSTVQFFVRTESKTVVVHSPRDSTIASVISAALRLSGAAEAAASPSQYRLIYLGRQLDFASTLSAAGVTRDATLHLAARLRSTRLPRSHRMVDDLLFSASCLLRSRPAPREIDALLLEFLASTPAAAHGAGGDDVDDTTIEHLSIFALAAVPAALVGLYLSDRPGCRLSAERAVRLFLRQAPEYVPKPAHLHCSVIVLQFCKLIAATCGRSDQLYVDSRSALALLMEPIASSYGSLRNLKLVVELYPFVSEVAGYMIEGIESEEIDVCPHNLSEFASFLAAMRTAIRQWLGGGGSGQISKSLLNDQNHPMQESWIHDLREVFIRLLRTVDECLRKYNDLPAEKGPEQGETVLAVLSGVHKFSKIYEDGHELLKEILVGRRDSVNALVRRAKRNEKLKWMLKYKDVTDFESRRNLTMMLFPEGKDDYERMHEMLIDRLQLLPESFEYIGQVEAQLLHGGLFVEFKNETATGPGVLREWFNLVCRALFNPQNVLFLQCPNDRRRFFPNPASVVDPLHLKYFGFCGRVIALALMHKMQLGVVFDRVFFLQLAGETITLEDVKDADPCLYMSCKKILEMDAQLLDSDALGLTFVREIEELGTQRAVELCPGGKDLL
ncbi:E3 ubiquitin-protein ligase UPL5 [Iris pallida]|uniref:HECT-type E3 ubiquitin transferase n=1 Tax=Iris pallida TaxID=29817 RepID=A0AAX6IGX9_IRIPA|nr:E3 ubiquitin-protein ligase UPL5 [Iris pallida]